MPKVGILTGGGDCPGLNGVIRAVVIKGHQLGYEAIGIKDGWRGLIKGETTPLDLTIVDDILGQGGTILGTSRTNLFNEDMGLALARKNFENFGIDALVAIGGEDTLGVAYKLFEEGLPVVGVPKTIDNDLLGTDFCFGFDTAINIAVEAIDRLRTTAASHSRVMVAEVMGRHAGWIAMHVGIASAADAILTPEYPMTVDEICKIIKTKRDRGCNYQIIVAAEGTPLDGLGLGEGFAKSTQETDAFGHVQLGGVGETLAKAIKEKTGFDTRHTVFGHIQRGGPPTAGDRFLSTSYGAHAMQLVHEKQFGKMPILTGNQIQTGDLKTVSEGIRTVPKELFELAKTFFV